jgi:hypothetical protein
MAWGGSPTRYTGFLGSSGFSSSLAANLNPGDTVTIKLRLILSYDSKTTGFFTESMTVLFNKQQIGGITWTNNSTETQIEKIITFNIPDGYTDSRFDIEVFS